ncbi:8-oxo-dGTP pyrophosphatase MutT, NUDIX family [Sphingomonas laterariae]|uniref:8-oxo-dGTP pyrophosphatase MutT, NUDIX family n=1 Tax=Edaphosphingomonas laterariae TaxID=861865 RepID=A0A239G6I1_9SPHN|nr:CoA pyrophosphatase [Sphingomonas laterariae]SNS64378.1 8-oxo-dGTP pyrophosphatase MutT, NUDIX family [Sphingomonas laterariae]
MMLATRLRTALADGQARDPILLEHDDADFALRAGEQIVPAAVLVPFVDRVDPTILMILRPETMRRHAGQIAFPGGRVDPGDDGVIGAALREAEEEIGLPRAHVDVVGTVDRYRTITGYDVTPVIGVLPPDLPLIAQPTEVADIFEIPLSFLLEPMNHIEQAVEWQGRERRFFEITWQDRRIWGATAAMIVNLARRLAYPA